MRHILVLAGGLSHERDVSLRSGRRVADALTRSGSETFVRDVDPTLLAAIRSSRPEVIWPVLHGASGEDGALQDVLGTLDIPYVGSRPASCRLTWDKPVAKVLVGAAGVSTPASVALSHATFRELGAPALLETVIDSLGLPLAVKPARGGSSLGLTIVRTAGELPSAMVTAYAYGDIALIEHFIEGVEVALSIIEDAKGEVHTLPAVEIVPDGGVYNYEARYTAGSTEFFTPARLSSSVATSVAAVSLKAYRTLGHQHLSRVDLIIDSDERPWFLEANVSPGMTETSLLPMAVEAAGMDASEVYAAIVERALTPTTRQT
ncbi:MAG TPA: D-alanine--D-alanine ligase [Dermatophilaceae bacterium]|nr:D-alanine--D-alanine ligase [Dermatophilaceae bacterium]